MNSAAAVLQQTGPLGRGGLQSNRYGRRQQSPLAAHQHPASRIASAVSESADAMDTGSDGGEDAGHDDYPMPGAEQLAAAAAALAVDEEMHNSIVSEDAWTVIEACFEQNTPATQQLQSYNAFVRTGIARVIGAMREIVHEGVGVLLDPGTLHFETPRVPLHASAAAGRGGGAASAQAAAARELLYPSEARLRKFTYESRFFCNVRLRHYVKCDGDESIRVDREEMHPRVPIGTVPVMIKSILCNLQVDYSTFTGETEHVSLDQHRRRREKQAREHRKECEYDTGGYFIINGVERIVIPQERLAANRPYTFHMQKKSGAAGGDDNENVDCVGGDGGDAADGSDGARDYVTEITSHDFEDTGGSGRQAMTRFSVYAKTMASYRSQESLSKEYKSSSAVMVQCQLSGLMRKPVLLPILLRALGLTDDMEIVCLISGDADIIRHVEQDTELRVRKTGMICQLLHDSIAVCSDSGLTTPEAALDHLAKRSGFDGLRREERVQAMRDALDERLLPHLGTGNLHKKAFYICYMANMLLGAVLGYRKVDDRDSFLVKRLQHTGPLLESLLYQSTRALAGRMTTSMRSSWERGRVFDPIEFLRSSGHVQQSMRYALGTGNWTTSHSASANGNVKSGVTQALNAINYFGRLSMFNKMQSSASDQSKVVKARQLHNSSFGVCCPCETPEGGQIGIVKNSSVLAHVSIGHNKRQIAEVVASAAMLVTESGHGNDSDFSDSDEEDTGNGDGDGDGDDDNDNDNDNDNDEAREHRRRRQRRRADAGISLFTSGSDGIFTGAFTVEKARLLEQTKIFVNGDWIGCTGKPKHLVRALRTLRRHTTEIPRDVSVYFDIYDGSVQVWCDAGRLMRPLYIVDKGNRLRISGQQIANLRQAIVRRKVNFVADAGRIVAEEPLPATDSGAMVARRLLFGRNAGPRDGDGAGESATWDDLFDHGLIELISVAESSHCMVAMTLEDLDSRDGVYCSTYTHCEIHPSTMLGIAASLIPFPDHNQSPRNTYQSAMCKQAQGSLTTRPEYRIDTIAYELGYPQKPVATTRTATFLNYDELPCGQMAIVAIACYTGYNQEDSVLMNLSAVERGFMRSFAYHSYNETCKSYNKESGVREHFEKPDRNDAVYGMRGDSYGKLDTDGMPFVGMLYSKGDAFLGKVMYHPEKIGSIRSGGQFTYFKTDASLVYSSDVPARVDKVVYTTNDKNERMVTVTFRSMRVPTIGDKVSSRHGQKGTIGMLYRQEDMPFTADGITPDIIINPHAVPSRMTIGQLVECLGGKASCLTTAGSTVVDATPFTDVSVGDFSNLLCKLGYEKRGLERMYNGATGRPIEALIFIGPTFYQRLRHMVNDKMQSRSHGPKSQLTRQPMQGKSRGGGIRFGEMERDCIIAHGGSALLRDRLLDCSDSYKTFVCGLCGIVGSVTTSHGNSKHTCRVCKTYRGVSTVTMPYAFKLLCQELMSMGVVPRLQIDEKDGRKSSTTTTATTTTTTAATAVAAAAAAAAAAARPRQFQQRRLRTMVQ